MASTDLVFSNEADANQALSEVRSDTNENNWCLFTYSESAKNTIDLVGKGTGGVVELTSHLNAAKMFYGLVRVTDKIDNSVTVKFVFIVWCGDHVPFVQKGKMTTHKGSISKLIGQYHNDINCSNVSELSEDIIMRKVRDASGTSVHVKEGGSSSSSSSTSSTSLTSSAGSASPSAPTAKSAKAAAHANAKPAAAPGSASVVQFIDEDKIKAALKAVRSDKDDTDWLLLSYDAPNSTKIVLQATGDGGIEELISKLSPSEVQYGLYRTTDTVDNTVAVKFVLILWVGEDVPVIRKARITTHKGELTAFIRQYHVDCSCSNHNEINEDIVRDLVQRASGTAVHVKNT
jgi:hypothetical protein